MKNQIFEAMKPLTEVFGRLNNLRRWTHVITEGRYDEISKQSLNCIITFILAKEAEKNGMKEVRWELFPRIAMYRAFQKVYVNYDTPERILQEICELGHLDYKKTSDDVTHQIISEKTSEEFYNWIYEGCETFEERLYKAGTKIATFVELKELQRSINGDYQERYNEVVNEMRKYRDIYGFNTLSDPEGDYFEVFKDFSKLRNQNRWAAYYYLVDCSVLGHLFDTAIFAYLMALENGESEDVATKCFFMGIFHDIPEAFTKDIPSPVKDKIPNFRSLTEQYELKMMEKHVYPKVSPEVREALQDVMFETDENIRFKRLMKGADYMSAVSELSRQTIAGSRDRGFAEAANRHYQQLVTRDKTDISASAEQLLIEMTEYIDIHIR